jgi:hypothetical protein
MKNLTAFLFIVWFSSTSLLMANQIEADLKILKKIVNKACENLSLNYESQTNTINNKTFLQNAEVRLRYAQLNSDNKDFLNYDYMNLGLYLLSLRFKRYKAALVVLKQQLAQEKNSKVIKWLKDRISIIEKYQDNKKSSKVLKFNNEIQIFRQLFE